MICLYDSRGAIDDYLTYVICNRSELTSLWNILSVHLKNNHQVDMLSSMP